MIAVVAIAGFALLVVVGLVKRIATTYTITNHRLHIKRGIIARHVQQARLDRVQNVNTDQGVIQRILQVGTVDFDTAGTTDSDFQFVGVAQPEKVMAAVDRAAARARRERLAAIRSGPRPSPQRPRSRRLEAVLLVGAVAERLRLRPAAAAEHERLAVGGQLVLVAVGVDQRAPAR